MLSHESHDDAETLRSKLAALEATHAKACVQLVEMRDALAKAVTERDTLRHNYRILREHYELLRLKLFCAKAERVDAAQLELEFAATKEKLDALAKQLGGENALATDGALGASSDAQGSDDDTRGKKKPKAKVTPKGRPNLHDVDLPEERIELCDPSLENVAERIDFEESCRLGYRKAGFVRIVVARAVYKKTAEGAEIAEAARSSSLFDKSDPIGSIKTVEKPRELVERGMFAPSLIAHLLVSKYRFGLPFYRLAQMLESHGMHVDDGTMCRYAEHVGASLGCEALLRLRATFQLEEDWRALPPQERHRQRQERHRPLVADFFAWAELEFARVKNTRGLVNAAFGCAARQKHALTRFLDDGRLPLTNNHSERALRTPICTGRKAWLFFGSDDHASAAANLFSLIASAELHGLDTETYIAEMIRLVPLWPRDRHLELAPKFWSKTRARLDPRQLEREIGPVNVPPPPTEEQSPPS